MLHIDHYIMLIKVRKKLLVSKQGGSCIKEMFNVGMLTSVKNEM